MSSAAHHDMFMADTHHLYPTGSLEKEEEVALEYACMDRHDADVVQAPT